jgi:hypothetical protein
VIAESPNGRATRLTDFGTASFTESKVDRQPIGASAPDRRIMVVPGTTTPRATPSPLSADGEDFSVTWMHQ